MAPVTAYLDRGALPRARNRFRRPKTVLAKADALASRPMSGYICATMRVVLDTSVLVAAMRSRRGASQRLLRSLPSPRFTPALSVALYMEWQAVLTRDEHRPPGVGVEQMLEFLRYLASLSHLQDVHYLWRPFLRDPDDDMVVECAVASGSRFIVTHNVRDFRRCSELGVEAISPGAFLHHPETLP